MNKVKGINKAMKEFNTYSGNAMIMYDKGDGKVWCDVFGKDKMWNEYDDRNIVPLLGKSFIFGDDQVNRKEIYAAINNIGVVEK